MSNKFGIFFFVSVASVDVKIGLAFNIINTYTG